MDIEAWLGGLPSQEQKRKRPATPTMEPEASGAASDQGSKRRRLEPGKGVTVTVLDSRLTLRHPIESQEGLSGQSSSSRNRSRKGSPARSMADLASAVPPILGCEIDLTETRLPESVSRLREKMMAFETLQGIFPACLQTHISTLLGRTFENKIYYSDDRGLPMDDERLIWGQVQKIRRCAKECGEREKPEPSWGEEVVRPLLNLSVEYWQMGGNDEDVTLCVENLTTATISPRHLAPTAAHDRPLEFKKIDYGLFLALGPDDSIGVKERLRSFDPLEQSVNQTMAGYVRNQPLVAFLELKKPNSESNPLVQLGIWASALLARLKLLSPIGTTDLLPMPVFKVVGHDWKVYYLHRADSGAVMLYGPQAIGSTLSIQGIYQVIKVLGATADYAVNDYWPWFRNNML